MHTYMCAPARLFLHPPTLATTTHTMDTLAPLPPPPLSFLLADRQTDRQAGRSDRQTEMQRCREADRDADRQTDKQPSRQTDRRFAHSGRRKSSERSRRL